MAGVKGMKGSGGARKGAGRKKNPAVKVADTATVATPGGEPDSIRVLRQITNDAALDAKLRLDAAKALAPFEAAKIGEGGKKDAKGGAAKKAAGGKFAPAAPPKLVVNNK